MIDELTVYNLSIKHPNTLDLVREVEKMARADAIEEFEKTKTNVLKWLIKRQAEGYGTSNGELLDHIYDIAKQLKSQDNMK